MTSRFKTAVLLVTAAVVPAFMPNASALTNLDYSTYGVGEWTPASEFNSDPVLINGVNRTVDIWNGAAPEGLYTLGGDSATFTKGAGTLVPPPTLIGPDAYVDRVEDIDFGSWTGLDNTSGEFTYLTAKYGNLTQRVFYIGNVLDVITVDTDLGPGVTGDGLSHVAWLRGGPGVPDGGSTLALLGISLLAALGLHRKFGRQHA